MTRLSILTLALCLSTSVLPADAQEKSEKQSTVQTKSDTVKETKKERRKRKLAERLKQEEDTKKQQEKDAKSGGEAKDQKTKTKEKPDKKKELTLENLFPEKSMFGSNASRPAFSTDGRFAAYLYRPRIERRHGSDIWLYDFEKKTNTRLTNVLMLAEFEESARKVKEDRLEKAKKKKSLSDKKKESDEQNTEESTDDDKSKTDDKQEDTKTSELSEEETLKIVTSVSDKDADDEKAPRYSGVSSFTWHPNDNAMLLSIGGDVYQIADVTAPKLTRLTKTEGRESRISYLPDGSGFTFTSDDVVHRIVFGQHMVEQINPKLSGLEMSSYQLSPNGQSLVVVGRSSRSTGTRTVDYIRYRDRFAKASTVPRTVSDDKTEPQDVAVFLYDLKKAKTEEAKLIEVFRTKIDEPRDVISSPEWAPDSSKVTFCFFDQKNAEVQILQAKLPEKKGDTDKSKSKDSDEKSEEEAKNEAKVVYRFQHFGGPNTPRMVAPEFAWDSHHIVFVSEQSGFRHVHMLNPLYESVKQLTNGHYEVYPQRMSKDHKHLFVTATKDSSAREMVYSINLESGEMQRLSKKDGTYSSVAVSNDGGRMLANFVTYGQLSETICQDGDQKPKSLTDPHSELAKHFTQTVPEFFEYENRHGHAIKGMAFKPKGWKKDQKHPLLIYVYGGPLGTRKSVVDGSFSSSAYFFNSYMAEKHDYITVVIDPRGQSGYGGVFEKANYKQVGKPQVEDLVDGVKYLTEEMNIDDKRVGIFGWSFGGFQTQMCLYTAPEVFQVGMAGAGPTEWENYNSWYATGTIGPSSTDKPDQKKYSLLPLAKNLKGKLLLVHGMEDTNVLFQDTVKVYRELLKAGKEVNVELFLDPTGSHGLGGDVKRVNRYRKYEDFLLRTLGEGATKEE